MPKAKTPTELGEIRAVVDAATKRALSAEQARIELATGSRPTQAEVVAAWLKDRALTASS